MIFLERVASVRIALCVMACGAALTVMAGSAQAQKSAKAPGEVTSATKFANVVSSCTTDYPRFCPPSASGTVGGRDQVICLKYFKSNLSLGCRRAVVAASQ